MAGLPWNNITVGGRPVLRPPGPTTVPDDRRSRYRAPAAPWLSGGGRDRNRRDGPRPAPQESLYPVRLPGPMRPRPSYSHRRQPPNDAFSHLSFRASWTGHRIRGRAPSRPLRTGPRTDHAPRASQETRGARFFIRLARPGSGHDSRHRGLRAATMGRMGGSEREWKDLPRRGARQSALAGPAPDRKDSQHGKNEY